MLGSSVGKSTLNDSRPPTTRQIHACHSKMLYSRLPLTAGFFWAVDERGAKVAAVWRTILFTSFSRSKSFAAPLVVACSVAAHAGAGGVWQRLLLWRYYHTKASSPPPARLGRCSAVPGNQASHARGKTKFICSGHAAYCSSLPPKLCLPHIPVGVEVPLSFALHTATRLFSVATR